MRILVTGQWPSVAELGRLLLDFGYEVVTHSESDKALVAWSHGDCEAALLSVTRSELLPFAAVKAFRERRPHASIVVVSDMAHLDSRVAGLDAGADDYITAPFAIPEFRARMNAIARHTTLRVPAEIRMGPLLIRAGDPMITIDGVRVEVTAARHIEPHLPFDQRPPKIPAPHCAPAGLAQERLSHGGRVRALTQIAP